MENPIKSQALFNNVFNRGADGAIMPVAGIQKKGAGANDYIFGFNPVCNNALCCDNSCHIHITQKVAPSVW